MIDLVPEQVEPALPESLTFDDIQKMHYTRLNNGGDREDEFRPQDFLDLDSGDSDNEILAKFRPEVEERKMISLMQPPSPIK